MGQIKNIKLHIVTDIKVEVWSRRRVARKVMTSAKTNPFSYRTTTKHISYSLTTTTTTRNHNKTENRNRKTGNRNIKSGNRNHKRDNKMGIKNRKWTWKKDFY